MFKFFRIYIPRGSQVHFAITLLIFIVVFISNKLATPFRPNIFVQRDNPLNELVADIRPYSDCCSYLLVWGAESQINFSLDKESPSRFFYQYALFSDSFATSTMINEFLRDIAIRKPLIVDASATDGEVPPIKHNLANFSGRKNEIIQPIQDYVAINYYPVHEMSNGWIIYSPNP